MKTEIRSQLRQLWDSPIATSWGSMGVRLASVLLIWPLALAKLSAAEVVIWQVFVTVMLLQPVADFGFSPTFARIAAATNCDALPAILASRKWQLKSAAQTAYLRLSWIAVGIVFVGTIVIGFRIAGIPQEEVSGSANGIWLAWSLAAGSFLISFATGGWTALVQGWGLLARLRRGEIATGGLGVVVAVGGLLAGGGLFSLSFAMFVASCAQAIWCRRLLSVAASDEVGSGEGFQNGEGIPLLRGVWKSGAGILFSTGLVQVSALVVAAAAKPEIAAAYLLGWRLISIVSQVSQVPFYGRLPEFGSLAGAGSRAELLARARTAMAVSLGLFVIGYMTLSVFGPRCVGQMGGDIRWPASDVWIILGIAMFVERYGAMHLQLDTLGHDVRWHVANGITAAIALAVMLLTFRHLGVAAVPLGLAIGNLVFYCPYAVRLSRKRYGWTWRRFDWPATAWFSVMVLGSVGLIL